MTRREFTIRDMRLDDVERVASMIEQLANHIAKGVTPKTTAADVVKYGPFGDGHFHGLVAERGGELQGLCLYTTLFSSWRGRPGLHVLDLFVDESARGTRVGKRMLASAIRRSQALGCTFVRLEVGRENRAAARFYARLGFVPHDTDLPLFLEEPAMLALAAAS